MKFEFFNFSWICQKNFPFFSDWQWNSIKKKYIFNIIKELKPTQFNLPDVTLLTNYFADLLKVKPCDKLNNKIKLQLKNFDRNLQSKTLQNSTCCSSNTDNSYVLESDNFTSLLDTKDQNLSES